MVKEQMAIMKKYLILCEGLDEKRFLIEYLNSQALLSDPRLSQEIQVMDFGGINELSNFLMGLRGADGFDGVSTLMIIRDAEKDCNAASQSVASSLKSAGFIAPSKISEWIDSNGIRIGFLLFPSCSLDPCNGTLEDLCLKILNDDHSDERMEDIELLLDKCSKSYEESFSKIHKNKLHAYLSTKNDFAGMKIGEAAQAGAFDWNSSILRGLKNFITDGFRKTKLLND